MKTKALVLDLDDTLYAEIDFLYSGYRYIAMQLEKESWKELFKKIVAMYHDGQNAFEYLSNKYNVDFVVLLEWYRFHSPDITLFENVYGVLESLYDDYKFAIVTDGRSVTQRNKIKALNIENFLNCIVISEEIGSEKPNIKNFLAVQDNLKCEDYIYIGDNPKKDFFAANKLGWRTICLKDKGKNIHKQNFDVDSEYLPQLYISDWSELLSLLNN